MLSDLQQINRPLENIKKTHITSLSLYFKVYGMVVLVISICLFFSYIFTLNGLIIRMIFGMKSEEGDHRLNGTLLFAT